MIEFTNVNEFNLELKRVMKDADNGGRKVLVKASMDAFRNLQRKTPKDTNRATAGWNSTVDSRPSEYKPRKGRDNYPKRKFEGVNRIKHDSVIHLSNNVEYIVPLDEGHSRVQAPNGIVNVVFAALTAHLMLLTKKEGKRKIK